MDFSSWVFSSKFSESRSKLCSLFVCVSTCAGVCKVERACVCVCICACVCLCVYVYMCVCCVYVCVCCVYVCVAQGFRDQIFTLICLLLNFLNKFLRQSFTEPGAHQGVKTSQSASSRDPFVSFFQGMWHHAQGFKVGSLGSGIHDCTAMMSPTEPSPSPQKPTPNIWAQNDLHEDSWTDTSSKNSSLV